MTFNRVNTIPANSFFKIISGIVALISFISAIIIVTSHFKWNKLLSIKIN
jgi:hypothetical protein